MIQNLHKKIYGNKLIYTCAGMISMAAYAAAFLVEQNSGLTMIVKIVLFIVSALCYLICALSAKSDSLRKQMAIINIAVLVFHLLFAYSVISPVVRFRHYSALVYILMWSSVPAYVLICGLLKDRNTYVLLRDDLIRNKALFISVITVSAVVIFLSWESDGPRFAWDTYLSYDHIPGTNDALSLLDIDRMVFIHHIAFSFFYPVSLLAMLFNSIEAAFVVYNSLGIVLASLGFALLFRDILPEKPWIMRLLATFTCMLSPYLLGLSNLYIYDYMAMCISPLLIWTTFRRKWGLFVALGLFVCFLKEPGAIYFGAVCLTLLVNDFAVKRKTIKEVLGDGKYWIALCIGIVFARTYLKVGNYGSTFGHTFGFNPTDMLHTVKSFCVLNFSWVMFLFAMALIVYVVVKRGDDRELKDILMIVAVPDLLFLIANCLLTSPPNPRYIDFFYSGLLIMAMTMIMLVIDNKYICTSVIAVVGILFVFANYYSFDPLSKLIYQNVNIGDRKLYSYKTGVYSDAAVYNRQWYGYDVALNKAISIGIDNKDEIIAISTGEDEGNWQTSEGRWSYDERDGVHEFKEYWDTQKCFRAPISPNRKDVDDKRYSTITINYVYPHSEPVSILAQGESFIYIYMPTLNGGREDLVRSKSIVSEEGEFYDKGWRIAYIRGIVED